MAAALLAFGVASALYRRERTGRGGRVDTSLLLAALALQNNLMVRVETLDGPRHAAFREWLAKARTGGVAFAEQVERMPRNRVVASQAIYIRTYATKDGALAVACGSPSLRRKFIAAIGHKDPALTEPVADVEGHYAALRAAVEATIASRTTQEWKAALDAAGVPASGVALPVEILDDPQPAANAMFQRFEHPTLGPVTVLGPPVQVDDGGFVPGPPTPPSPRWSTRQRPARGISRSSASIPRARARSPSAPRISRSTRRIWCPPAPRCAASATSIVPASAWQRRPARTTSCSSAVTSSPPSSCARRMRRRPSSWSRRARWMHWRDCARR